MTEIALIGKKIGMTREFYKTGQLVPVTVLKVEKARVVQVIDEEKRGYKAISLIIKFLFPHLHQKPNLISLMLLLFVVLVQ